MLRLSEYRTIAKKLLLKTSNVYFGMLDSSIRAIRCSIYARPTQKHGNFVLRWTPVHWILNYSVCHRIAMDNGLYESGWSGPVLILTIDCTKYLMFTLIVWNQGSLLLFDAVSHVLKDFMASQKVLDWWWHRSQQSKAVPEHTYFCSSLLIY